MKCITISCYKSYYYFIIFWIASILISALVSYFNNKNKDSQNIKNTFAIINMICQIVADLFAGFLVLYTYLTSSSVIIKEKENNIIDKNNDLYIKESSKKFNRCSLILKVSIIEFIIRIVDPIFNLFYKSLEIGEIIWLFFSTILSRIFFSHYKLKLIYIDIIIFH